MTIFGRRDADATLARQAAAVPSGATDAPARSDPAQLRSDAAQLVAVATADGERGVRDAQALADALLAEASQLEADQAERERVGAYLAAVEHGQGVFAQTVTGWERARTALAQATTERDAQRERQRQAEAEAAQASRQLRSLADGVADFDAIKSARIDLAAAEDVPRLLAPSVERAEGTVTQRQERLAEKELAVRRAWVVLQNLSAIEGVERPACVPAPRSSLAEKLADFAAHGRHHASASQPRGSTRESTRAPLVATRPGGSCPQSSTR